MSVTHHHINGNISGHTLRSKVVLDKLVVDIERAVNVRVERDDLLDAAGRLSTSRRIGNISWDSTDCNVSPNTPRRGRIVGLVETM